MFHGILDWRLGSNQSIKHKKNNKFWKQFFEFETKALGYHTYPVRYFKKQFKDPHCRQSEPSGPLLW